MHQNIWYPFTVLKNAPEPLKVKKGDGLWLELEDGSRIMDCISSWWVNLYGHAHPKVADAITEQANTLSKSFLPILRTTRPSRWLKSWLHSCPVI